MRPWKHNERAAEPEIFDREVRTVCECYAEALRLHEEGVHLVSTDEKSSIQALERLHPSLPMRPGLIERYEHESMCATAPALCDRQPGGGNRQGDRSLHR